MYFFFGVFPIIFLKCIFRAHITGFFWLETTNAFFAKTASAKKLALILPGKIREISAKKSFLGIFSLLCNILYTVVNKLYAGTIYCSI